MLSIIHEHDKPHKKLQQEYEIKVEKKKTKSVKDQISYKMLFFVLVVLHYKGMIIIKNMITQRKVTYRGRDRNFITSTRWLKIMINLVN